MRINLPILCLLFVAACAPDRPELGDIAALVDQDNDGIGQLEDCDDLDPAITRRFTPVGECDINDPCRDDSYCASGLVCDPELKRCIGIIGGTGGTGGGTETDGDNGEVGGDGGDGTTGAGGSTGMSGGDISDTEPDPSAPELPLYVDDWYAPSGYMGDGGSDGIAHAPCDDEQRSMRTCHRFTWTPGLRGWAGVFWQYPDGNWGTEPGLMMPQGARSIRFLAWGDEGGETISFGAGMEHADGFARSTVMTLTTEPTEYIVSLDGAEYTSVAGGFVWIAEGADFPVTFRVADIRWSTEAAPVIEPETPAGELPVDVDAHFNPVGYMGEVMSVNPVDCPTAAVDGPCFGFEWTPTEGGPGWAGVVWQYPDGNWGAEPGLAIVPGATAIQFTAWGQMGGESVTFGAGYGANSTDGFDVSTGEIVLNAEPTQYEIPLDGVTYETVASGFRWTTVSPTDTTFYVGAIRWIP